MADDKKVDIWMPLYVSDFLTATLGWSAEERGHYLTLLMAQWAMGGLPSDPKALERISPGVGGCWEMLGEKFPAGPDGKLRNGRLEEHRAKSLDLREERSKRASKAAQKRWAGDVGEGGDGAASTGEECSGQCSEQCSGHCVEKCSSYAASSSSSQEELQPAAPVPTSRPAAAVRSPAKAGIAWSSADGWAGITEQDRGEWATAYPGAILDQELAKATAWLRANPKRAGRRNWRRFLVGWLQRCQDKGGSVRGASVRPGDAPAAARPWTGADAEAFERTRRKLAGQSG